MPRQTGSKNKRKEEFRKALRKYCEDKGVDPHFWMVDILKKQGVTTAIKIQAAKELAQYLEPKLRAVEISGNAEKPLAIQSMTPEQLDSRIEELTRRYVALRNGHEVSIGDDDDG